MKPSTNRSRRQTFMPGTGVGSVLNRVRKLMAAEMHEALEGTGVTGSQVSALLLLARGLASSPVELSKQLGVNAGFVTRLLDGLENKGLLLRCRSREDRRVVNLTLTQEGQDIAARMAKIAPAVLNGRFSRLSSKEFDVLDRLLRKLLSA
jgi:DNA-binding MarR family transcriptional regulator